MSAEYPAVVELQGVSKDYRGLRPLRLTELRVSRGERVGLAGIDAPAAEVLVTLLTGASVPDAGEIRILGRRTVDIASETEWLASLEHFGLVTHRAALLEGLTVAQNLALPFTIDLDPVPDDVWPKVKTLAAEVELPESALGAAVARLAPHERLRVHVARALAVDPLLMVLEHPTVHIPRDDVAAVARMIGVVAQRRGLTVLSVSEDEVFARVACTRRLKLQPGTGVLAPADGWRRLFTR
jgi:phospholipid/cholesterol/gamma-HCH transport system ATP-binding protein